ncbi:MAG: ATP synthase F1 subunit epsilon [Actinobacteria bacterium]|jgi:F-type H+-transporting ATPase subunit epsilon|nr:ATP synthase F1 subunit epsilon [Actinomycetota bacterium]
MALAVELVSPERTLFSGDATMVRARTVGGGDIAFLTGHTPFVGALAVSTIEITLAEGGSEIAAVHGGFIEVSNDHVKILSDLAELASTIDVERARRAEEKAQAAIARGDDAEAQGALARATARLGAAGQLS